MKYKVSVIKKIAFLVMTMALAVAMVACRVLSASQGRQVRKAAGEPVTPTDPTTTPVASGAGADDQGDDAIIFNDAATGQDPDRGRRSV